MKSQNQVWIVFIGEYDERKVHGVYSLEDDARAEIAAANRFGVPAEFEEHTVQNHVFGKLDNGPDVR